MVDERSLRRPTFSGGVPIRFGDGQFWVVPMPECAGDPTEEASEDSRFGPGYLDLLRAIMEAEDLTECRRGELALAIRLLRSNYELDPPLYEMLLSFNSHEERVRMRRAMTDVVTAHLRAAFPDPDPAHEVLDNGGYWNRPLSARPLCEQLGRIPRRVLMTASNALSRFST